MRGALFVYFLITIRRWLACGLEGGLFLSVKSQSVDGIARGFGARHLVFDFLSHSR